MRRPGGRGLGDRWGMSGREKKCRWKARLRKKRMGKEIRANKRKLWGNNPRTRLYKSPNNKSSRRNPIFPSKTSKNSKTFTN